MYELSTSFVAHTADIVGLAVNVDDSIITCSKDKTIKTWKYNESTKKFFEAEIFYSTSNLLCKFPTCVCILLPTDLFECGLIVTGDNDNRIFVYEPNNPIPIRHTRAHSNTVSKITGSPEPNVFLSASWDTTVKIWMVCGESLECLRTIQSHSVSVWAVLQMKRKFILTGSADKLIRIFDVDGNLMNTLNGHEDCVRDLVEINDEQILSCSNDSTVRRWSVDSGKCLEILTGHPNYVYSVRMVNDLIVSSGEDKCLLLWSLGKPVQTITLPARSIWTVDVMSNNDIVVGSSDGVVRVFTASKNRRADEKTLLNFTEECSNQYPMKVTMGRRKFSRLPGPNILSNPGDKEGQKVFVRLIRESKKVNCFSWSLTEKKWKNVGLVDVDFTPLVASNFKCEAKTSINGKNEQLIPEEPGKLSCAVCRKKFRMKSSLRRHVIESEHTIAERTPESLLPILPNTHPYQVISFEKSGSFFTLKLCLENMNSRNDLQIWIRSFAELSKCVYWRFNTKRYGSGGSKYSEFYRCQHRYSTKMNGRKVRTRNKGTNCKSTINGMLIHDSIENSYYAKININFCHNHPIHEISKHKRPTPEVRDKFRLMCHDGLTPAKALQAYRKRLELESPEMFSSLLLDRSVLPDYDWVRHFFRKVRAEISSVSEKVADETQELEQSTCSPDERTETEDTDAIYEYVQCDEIKTEKFVSKVCERPDEDGAHIIQEIVNEFGLFLGKLEEDPSYYREGIQSMSYELKKLGESTAEARLLAMCSFNKRASEVSASAMARFKCQLESVHSPLTFLYLLSILLHLNMHQV